MEKRWFVYLLLDGTVVLYVGKGQGNRHLVSQRRHGGDAQIVKRFSREGAALRYEKKLIAQYTPQCNKTAGGEGRSVKSVPNPLAIERRWAREAYAREKSGWWLNRLAAMAYRKCEGIQPSIEELKWLTDLAKELMRSGGDLNRRLQAVAS